MTKYLIIESTNELLRVSPDRIVYISSDGNYSTLVLYDKKERVFSFNLKTFQDMIENQLKEDAQQFIRIGKSLIINKNYIYLINISKQQLILSDMKLQHEFCLSASKEALKQLKNILGNKNEREK